jgi:hypothetical protein
MVDDKLFTPGKLANDKLFAPGKLANDKLFAPGKLGNDKLFATDRHGQQRRRRSLTSAQGCCNPGKPISKRQNSERVGELKQNQ